MIDCEAPADASEWVICSAQVVEPIITAVVAVGQVSAVLAILTTGFILAKRAISRIS